MTTQNKHNKLGFWSIVFLAINSIIGSGIFLTPQSVVKKADSKTLLVYLIAAVFAAILAVSFASAAKYVNQSGSSYAYSKAAFGDGVGFYAGILRYFSVSVAWGVMAVGIINLFGQKFVKYVMNIATIGKVAALVLIIIAGTILLIKTDTIHNLTTVDHLTQNGHQLIPKLTMTSFTMAIVSAFYAFTGFESVASGADDMEKPEHNLPRAIPLAILVIAIIYIGVIVVALLLNPKAIMTTTQAVAISAIFQNKLLRNLILIGALISMLGVNIASSFNAPRVLEAMARQGQMTHSLTKRASNGFPARTFFISMLLAVLIPTAFNFNLTNLITLSAMVRFFDFIIVPLAVIYFYRGKSKAAVLPAAKNILTDLIAPVLSIILVILLLIVYDWRGQFGIVVRGQVVGVNWFAIAVIAFGFIILPLLMYGLVKFEQHHH